MHAEYKVPGGKLLVIDLETDGRQIIDARLSGDFFLEPPEALSDIDAALEGLPVEASEAEIVAAVTAALPEGTEMFGISSEAVAVVVRRALA
ncbi:biotin--protein ligase [Corticimicrobacter populi]|uniref:Biotin--protein ligase n=1 Tax=Corticimicrobacter populi TaxID=2175229 RepID=A0A2V1JXR6_9BURK|nr:biotin--protein ligase [Corticimicrobacter populi]PWF21028.1 biotin--protein ligase [Corticimicrobacter populi]